LINICTGPDIVEKGSEKQIQVIKKAETTYLHLPSVTTLQQGFSNILTGTMKEIHDKWEKIEEKLNKQTPFPLWNLVLVSIVNFGVGIFVSFMLMLCCFPALQRHGIRLLVSS
jgi:uncharacterized membrane protein